MKLFLTVVLEKTLESSLDSKIKPVNPKGSQPWIFIGRTDAEDPTVWPPDAKSWLIGKAPDAGKDWGQEDKGMTEDEMGITDSMDVSLSKLWETVKWSLAAAYGVAESDMTLQLNMKLFLPVMSTSINPGSAPWSQTVFPENPLHPTSLDCDVKATKETKFLGVFKSSGPVNCLLHVTQDFSLLIRPCGTLFVFNFPFVSSLRAKSNFSWEFLGSLAVRPPCFH